MRDPRPAVKLYLAKRMDEIRGTLRLGESSSESFRSVLRSAVQEAYRDERLSDREVEERVDKAVARTMEENKKFLEEHIQALRFLEHGEVGFALELLRGQENYFVGYFRELLHERIPKSLHSSIRLEKKEFEHVCVLISRLEEWSDEQRAPSIH